jgi:hypothetical protein
MVIPRSRVKPTLAVSDCFLAGLQIPITPENVKCTTKPIRCISTHSELEIHGRSFNVMLSAEVDCPFWFISDVVTIDFSIWAIIVTSHQLTSCGPVFG